MNATQRDQFLAQQALFCCSARAGIKSSARTVESLGGRLTHSVPRLAFVVALLSTMAVEPAFATSLSVTTLSSFTGQSSGSVSQARSLRGLAVTTDNSKVESGFIQGSSSSNLREVDSTSGSILNSVAIGFSGATSFQPKGVATDDRGNVFATVNNPSGTTNSSVSTSNLAFRAYDSALVQQSNTPTKTTSVASQLGGISAVHIGSDYFVYVAHNRGSGISGGGQIERWNVNNILAPTLDTTFGTAGVLDLKTLTGDADAFVNGLEVTSDGTIYATGGLSNSSSSRGDEVFKIANDLTTWSGAAVDQALDLALYGGKIYVAQYKADSSTIAVLDQSTLGLLDTLVPTISHPNTANDSGYSGIAIGSDGRLYLADQIYNQTLVSGTTTVFDRILVAQVPEPSTWLLAVLGGACILAMKRHRSGRS